MSAEPIATSRQSDVNLGAVFRRLGSVPACSWDRRHYFLWDLYVLFNINLRHGVIWTPSGARKRYIILINHWEPPSIRPSTRNQRYNALTTWVSLITILTSMRKSVHLICGIFLPHTESLIQYHAAPKHKAHISHELISGAAAYEVILEHSFWLNVYSIANCRLPKLTKTMSPRMASLIATPKQRRSCMLIQCILITFIDHISLAPPTLEHSSTEKSKPEG